MKKRGRGRPASGTVVWAGDHWRIRITLLDGSRPWFDLNPRISEKEARKLAREASELARKEKRVLISPKGEAKEDPGGETVRFWSSRWLDYREERGLESVSDDRARVRDHVLPVIGDIAMADVTEDHIRDVVHSLDEKVGKGELAWKTASNVWVLVRKMFKDACSAKRRDLRVRKDDPTENVAPPERGEELARTYLYPSEFLQLVHCKEVPVHWRRLYVLAAYTLSRAGELAALRWDAVDLERGIITFRQARKRKGGVKGTKTQKTRRIPIEPALVPLLRALKEEAGDSDVVIHVPVSKLAETLRKHLRIAGLTRVELYPPPKDGSVARTWAPLTFHDLRGTGVTWMALRGDEPLVIQQRAGHEHFSTTQRYLREAETLGRDSGSPFPPLPEDLFSSRFSSFDAKAREFLERDTGLEPEEASPSAGTLHENTGDSCQLPASDDVSVSPGTIFGTKIEGGKKRRKRRAPRAVRRVWRECVAVATGAVQVSDPEAFLASRLRFLARVVPQTRPLRMAGGAS